jgi:uncharacterized protein (AIM24 family)
VVEPDAAAPTVADVDLEAGFLLKRLSGRGHAWIELSGEIFQYELQAGETMRVHPGHIGMLDGSVVYELTTVPGLKNKIFGGDGLFLMRLTGPGRIWLQSMTLPVLAHALAPYMPAPTASVGTSAGISNSSATNGIVDIADGIADLIR